VWAADSISKTIAEMQSVQQMASKRPLDWFYIVNQKNPRTLAGKAILRGLEKSGADVIDSHICERACFVEATSQGLTIFETEPARSKARLELEGLGDDLRAIINQRQQGRAAA